ncbi:putative ankyrin repeat protein RF_0381 isoform X2 [Oscarella lobularis]|uniref:putative ankyrin repeat protein RF_0381 isoform X2 n=1 Tax=Oscarella lobularis TaxID=121494 RepID=UPI003313BE50
MGNSDSSVHPLTRAVVNGDLARLQKLMSKTENWADVKDRNGHGLLHSAAWKNRVEVAEYLTANGINIELRNDIGETPFLVACQSGSAALVDLLISKRCNRLAETTLGRGALTLAVIAGQFEMTKKLVEMGFDVNKPCDKAGGTSLHWAAAKGSAQIATFLIDNGANLEAKMKNGFTPIMEAVMLANIEVIGLLISKGCDVRAEDKDGEGLLHWAAFANCPKIAEQLIANGLNIELRSDRGETPFLVACRYGSAACVDLLISKGCNRLAEDRSGEGALNLSIMVKEFEMTKKLVKMGFDVNKPCERNGFSSLHWAVLREKRIQIVVKFLIDNGANLEAETKAGMTPLLIAVCCDDNVDLVDFLISKGCDVWKKDRDGDGLLHLAAWRNRLKVAEYLIAIGMNIEHRNNRDETPFLLACKYGNADFVDLLISKGCNRLAESTTGGALALAIIGRQFEMTQKLVKLGFDVNKPCEKADGYTSLHWAVSKEGNQIVNFLIEKGANLEAKTKTGSTPIMIAVYNGNVDLLDLLISKRCDVRAKDECGHGLLVVAVWGERVDMFKTILRMGFDVNEKCSNGRTCLHFAASDNSASIAALLLEQGADMEPRNKWGRTPFLTAVIRGSNNVANLLSAKGCNIHAKDEDGHGAFVLACRKHQYDTVKLLLSKFNYLNEEGASMLHWAAHNDYQRMAALLISHGVDLEAKDEWGCTPFLTAVEFGSDNTIDLLISKKCNIFTNARDGASALDLAILGGRLDLFRRFVNPGVTVDYLAQGTRDFLSKLVADENEEASKYLREVEAPLHVLQKKDVVISEPESKHDDLRNDISGALAPENDAVKAADGGEAEETVQRVSQKRRPFFQSLLAQIQ